MNSKMTHRLVAHNPNSACAVPDQHLGRPCEIISEDKRLGTITVAFYDAEIHNTVALMVDKECVERL